MSRGFYALGSGILTQNRTLDTISNNIANSNTIGFKKDKVLTTSFGDMVVSRLDSQTTALGNVSMINTVGETATDYSQGMLKNTGRTLDFAIQGEGFFAVQTDNGMVYTRNGSLNIDSDGYLSLNGVGHVMGTNGPIKLGTDDITADSSGKIYVDNKQVNQLAIYNFNNYANLENMGQGTFNAANPILQADANLIWQSVENSNVDAAEEMTNMISAQRELQSCSQAMKMYDTIMGKAATEIGKL